jgi:hypothetical protein
MTDGYLILDNSCYQRIEDPGVMARLKASMRAIGLQPGVSEVGLIEAFETNPPSVHARLFATIREFIEDAPLLLWPFDVLEQIGRAFLAGETHVPLTPTGREHYLEDAEAREAVRRKVKEFNQEIEEKFNKLHADARPGIQRRLKARGERNAPAGLRAFLDDGWPRSEVYWRFADATWAQLGLPGEMPRDLVDGSLAWRLFLDGEGSGVYNRAIATPQPPAVQRKDLLQLVYLALHGQRILVTKDGPFRDTAAVIVSGRYPGARVLHIDELLRLVG